MATAGSVEVHRGEQRYSIKGIRNFPQKSVNLTCSLLASKYTPEIKGMMNLRVEGNEKRIILPLHLGFTQKFAD